MGQATRVLITVLKWWTVLTLVALLSLYTTDPERSLRSSWGVLFATTNSLSELFPFVAFAGGVAASVFGARRGRALRSLLLPVLLLSLVAYVAGAWIAPLAVVEADRQAGIAVDERYPAGAPTPSSLLEQRRLVIEAAPARHQNSIDRPLQMPPNWLLYRVHQRIAVATFGVINALIGFFVGLATSGLSPPRLRHARWVLGLVSGVSFLLAGVAGTHWALASPDHSGTFAAWLPVAVPLLLLAVAYAVAGRSRHRDLHAEPSHIV